MSRILLVDDSPHAQRMGERILSEEGFEVVTVSNADSALIRMEDVDPDVVLADTVMPGRSGYDVCHFVKMSPHHRHVRVVLTAGVLEPLDEEQVQRVQADATLQKPFEASLLIATVKPLAERAAADRTAAGPGGRAAALGAKPAPGGKPPVAPFAAVVDAEQVRAAVTVALDAAMETIVDEIAARVLSALQPRKAAVSPSPAPSVAPVAVAAPTPPAVPGPAAPTVETAVVPVQPTPKPAAATSAPAAPPPATPAPAIRVTPVTRPVVEPKLARPAAIAPSVPSSVAPPVPPAAATPSTAPPPRLETVRRVNTLRSRPGSILGLDLSYVEPEVPAAAPHSPSMEPLFPNSRPAADPDPAPRGSRPGGSEPASRPPNSDSRSDK